jgi:hypothetical protein
MIKSIKFSKLNSFYFPTFSQQPNGTIFQYKRMINGEFNPSLFSMEFACRYSYLALLVWFEVWSCEGFLAVVQLVDYVSEIFSFLVKSL